MSLIRPVRLSPGALRRLPRNLVVSVALRLALHPTGSATSVLSALSETTTSRCQCHRRFQSTTGGPRNPNRPRSDKEDDGSAPPPRQTLTRVLLRGLWASFRSLGAPFRIENIRRVYKQSPGELVFALSILAGLAVVIVYVSRLYYTYFYSEQFTRYPEPVAKALRRALYYSNYAPDPKLALKYYKQALELCDELRVDPFSDDVMGIKIQIAAWLEKSENYAGSAKVLEALLRDCKRWVEVMERTVKEGKSTQALMPPFMPPTPGAPVPDEGAVVEVPETLWGKRTRILGKSVGISVKLADLYSDEHIRKPELAHERLVWAVETALKELQRRTVEGSKDSEGTWMSAEEIGATIESLGNSYETRSQFHLALPLFFQALGLSKDQCHSAVLMNNIATCFAQHPVLPAGEAAVDAMMKDIETSSDPAVRRASYLAAARRWATNAEQHASEPQGEKRTAECDHACAVSLCNLGDIAKLSGNPAEAREMYEKAVALSKSIGFAAGVVQAEAGLEALAPSVP
ncbi:hypothetical protein QBC47DRAFT_220416 [Echria macrotheca]|uniref:Uncharacterized protein n=1 Tax=Echria macrotheca TaxID=438768 RepID=A0AAJ0BD28_9PEZI|nr:hypothetical protein QBC47DRAFT_220416 [Echria macrotheca]